MKISSDASKHNTCYERLERSEMKKPEIWPVVTTPLYDHSVCRDASQQQYRQQCQIMKENQTGRKGILFHQFCCLCHSGWHKSGLGFSLLFQHFYKKSTVSSLGSSFPIWCKNREIWQHCCYVTVWLLQSLIYHPFWICWWFLQLRFSILFGNSPSAKEGISEHCLSVPSQCP